MKNSVNIVSKLLSEYTLQTFYKFTSVETGLNFLVIIEFFSRIFKIFIAAPISYLRGRKEEKSWYVELRLYLGSSRINRRTSCLSPYLQVNYILYINMRSVFDNGGVYGFARIPNWPPRYRTTCLGIPLSGLHQDKVRSVLVWCKDL